MTTELANIEHRDYTGSKLGMWFFLFTEILLFGGLFLVYSVYRYMNAAEFHAAATGLSTVMGTANTVILLTSSLTMALAITALQRGNTRASIQLQATTIVLGLVFLVNKYIEWSGHIHEGIYPNAPELLARGHGQTLFYGLYYVMTGLHGLHVVAGLVLIGIMLTQTVRRQITGSDHVKLENAGLYWHLVDLIWIYLFPLFYLIT
ncbi:MAG: cytochrome c oxidase subunit 3 family protein [Nitrospirae bacterium]|nr:cytochrome c oxidase subunit 3 family protein [Nitrospirota bacterium]